jgi:hypothetical protein
MYVFKYLMLSLIRSSLTGVKKGQSTLTVSGLAKSAGIARVITHLSKRFSCR